jgi:hypothetical protein
MGGTNSLSHPGSRCLIYGRLNTILAIFAKEQITPADKSPTVLTRMKGWDDEDLPIKQVVTPGNTTPNTHDGITSSNVEDTRAVSELHENVPLVTR